MYEARALARVCVCVYTSVDFFYNNSFITLNFIFSFFIWLIFLYNML